jgi:hypothetical protein
MNWRAILFVGFAASACVPTDDGESNGDVDMGEGEPATCEAQLTQEACVATMSESGNRPCAWVSVQTFSDLDACEVAATESRCIDTWDQGNGCSWWSCDQTNYYTRIGDAGTELFSWTPDICGHEPFHDDGWRQCGWNPAAGVWSEGQICDCACGSPPSGTEP